MIDQRTEEKLAEFGKRLAEHQAEEFGEATEPYSAQEILLLCEGVKEDLEAGKSVEAVLRSYVSGPPQN